MTTKYTISHREMINEAIIALNNEASIIEVQNWILIHYQVDQISLRTISTEMADLCIDSRTSNWSEDNRFLKRVSRGKYRII